jgi:16S rRNA (uracil1498-N3)-methyltransferase
MQNFRQFITQPFDGQKFIAHCYDNIPETDNAKPFLGDVTDTTSNSLVLIGPEGDFSIEEVKFALTKGYQSVSLGKSRLRTETAALVAVHCMQIKNQI